ncbi:GGDEF domain-containing protein [Patescibacteria group bacterium]|nr:GGDEF domain-containing protein [Patescibacteria group bacterium]
MSPSEGALELLSLPEREAYNRLRYKPPPLLLRGLKAHLREEYARLYDDLLFRLLPIALPNVDVPVFESMLRRGVVSSFYEAQKAQRDYLTSLPNKPVLVSITNRYMDMIRENIPGTVSVIVIDIDHFKKGVNDVHGHEIGNQVLQTVGNMVSAIKRPYDIAGLGFDGTRRNIDAHVAGKAENGDEYGLIFFGAGDIPVEELQRRLERQYELNKNLPGMEAIGLSVGVVHFNQESLPGLTAQDLFNQADIAMYNAKTIDWQRQRIKVVEYTEHMTIPEGLDR